MDQNVVTNAEAVTWSKKIVLPFSLHLKGMQQISGELLLHFQN
jgi:hypothetical protein